MTPFRLQSNIHSLLTQRKIQLQKRKLRIRKAPKMLYPNSIERDYIRDLIGLTDTLKERTQEILIPLLPRIIEESNLLRPRKTDTYSDLIYETMQKLRFGFGNTYTERDMEDMASTMAELTSNFSRKQVGRVLSTMIGIDVFFNEAWLQDEMKGFVENNVALIKSIPQKYFSEIEGITFQGARQGLTINTIKDQIEKRYEVSESKATLIARDQIGKFFGQLNELRQQDVGIDKYVWRTVGDNRVRPSHRDKDGRVFSWNRPPADTGHPGWDYQCRCWAEPYLQDLI